MFHGGTFSWFCEEPFAQNPGGLPVCSTWNISTPYPMARPNLDGPGQEARPKATPSPAVHKLHKILALRSKMYFDRLSLPADSE